jgi:hypothetical protein
MKDKDLIEGVAIATISIALTMIAVSLATGFPY